MAKILLLPPFSLVAETLQEFDKNLVESFGLLQIHHMPRTRNENRTVWFDRTYT